MASFYGMVRLESDPGTAVRALVEVGDSGVMLVAGDEELGSWGRDDISVFQVGDSYMLTADGERLVLDVDEGAAFGAAVGLDPTPARMRVREILAPSTEATPAPPTKRRRRLRRRRADDAVSQEPTEPAQAAPAVAEAVPVAEPDQVTEPQTVGTSEPEAAAVAEEAAAMVTEPVGEAEATDDATSASSLDVAPPEQKAPPAPLDPPPPPPPPAQAPPPAPPVEEAPREPELLEGNVTGGISAGFQTLRDRSAVHYTEDEVLKRPIGMALAGAGLALLIGAVLSWGSARVVRGTNVALGRILAGLAGLFVIAGAYTRPSTNSGDSEHGLPLVAASRS